MWAPQRQSWRDGLTDGQANRCRQTDAGERKREKQRKWREREKVTGIERETEREHKSRILFSVSVQFHIQIFLKGFH